MQKTGRIYLIAVVAILLVLVFGILSNTITGALAQQQQQITGKINGMGTSQIPLRVCGESFTKDFLTVKFEASFLLSSDEKTGKVTSGSGLLDTTDSNVFAPLSITGGTIDIGVEPNLYTLEGTASFQSSSYCNLPSTVKFSIAKPDGSQLKCGNTDLITFNSIPLTGSITGNVNCIAVGTTPPHPQSNIKTHTMPPEKVNIILATDGDGTSISNDAVVKSNSITFDLSTPTDDVGVASLECNIDGSTQACPGGSISYNDLNPGSHTFRFTAKDSEGNTSSDIFTWTILGSSCPTGTTLTSGKCVSGSSCPTGTTLTSGKCEANLTCPTGSSVNPKTHKCEASSANAKGLAGKK